MALSRRFLCGVLLVAAAFLSGCGKKGVLVPPEALVPAPITNLAAAQKGDRIEVSWSAPGKQEGGAPLRDLGGFLLFRRPVLPPGEDCEECLSAYALLQRVDLEFPQGARQAGQLWIYSDRDLNRGMTYQYKVRSFTTQGAEGKDSNKVRRTFFSPPPPPVLEALPSDDGVILAYVALPPEEGTVVGYNIYRSKKGEPLPTVPLNTAPVTGNTYKDETARFGVAYDYAVTSLVKVGAETVESARSNDVAGGIRVPE